MAHRAQSIGVEEGSIDRPSGLADPQRPGAHFPAGDTKIAAPGPAPRVDAAVVLDTTRYQVVFGPVGAPLAAPIAATVA